MNHPSHQHALPSTATRCPASGGRHEEHAPLFVGRAPGRVGRLFQYHRVLFGVVSVLNHKHTGHAVGALAWRYVPVNCTLVLTQVSLQRRLDVSVALDKAVVHLPEELVLLLKAGRELVHVGVGRLVLEPDLGVRAHHVLDATAVKAHEDKVLKL